MGPNIGFIGVGHLGSALLTGILRSGEVAPGRLVICDSSTAALGKFPDLSQVEDPAGVVSRCGLIFLCVRPDAAQSVLSSLSAPGKVILSAVAGMEARVIHDCTGANVLRIMPNLPAALDEAATAYAEPNDLHAVQLEAALDVLNMVGITVPVSEDDFDVVTGLSGSGPAYVYLLLEGLIAGACRRGLTEQAARRLAAQTVRGAAAVVLDSDESLETLIAGVATPGGTTAAGLGVLEASGFAEHASWAVDAAAVRAEQLGRPAQKRTGSGSNCKQLFAKDKFCE